MRKNLKNTYENTLSGYKVLIDRNNGNIICGYKKSQCACGRRYITQNGYRKAHGLEY